MQIRSQSLLALSFFATMAMPLQAAQPAIASAAMQDASRLATPEKEPVRKRVNKLPVDRRASMEAKEAAKEADSSSSMVLQGSDLQIHEMKPKLEKAQNPLIISDPTGPPPVITDPGRSGYVCCATRARTYEQEVSISTTFHVSGDGLPGHRIKTRVFLNNNGSRSFVDDDTVKVGADGHWKSRKYQVTSPDMNTNSGSVEITATQYFPPTRVRQPAGEADAQPVFLRFRTPSRHPMGQAGSSSG